MSLQSILHLYSSQTAVVTVVVGVVVDGGIVSDVVGVGGDVVIGGGVVVFGVVNDVVDGGIIIGGGGVVVGGIVIGVVVGGGGIVIGGGVVVLNVYKSNTNKNTNKKPQNISEPTPNNCNTKNIQKTLRIGSIIVCFCFYQYQQQ